MKTLTFTYDEQDELVITSDVKEAVETLKTIPSMFAKKAWLADNGWSNVKIGDVRCWYTPETDVEKLEVMLAGHDFFYYQSDNIDTFLRGERYLAKLEEQFKVLPLVEAVALWNKYAPKELQKQLPE